MQELLKIQVKLVPEILDVLEMRYNILTNIYYSQPIGRRLLATNLKLSERVVRSEINFLKDQKLIEISNPGMTITSEGEEILQGLKNFIREMKEFKSLEEGIKSKLNLKDIIIVAGDIDEDSSVLNELGKITVNYIKKILQDNIIISLTGGNTVKEVVDNFPNVQGFENILVLPARGGIGKDIECHSNTLAGRLASKLNGNYEILHIPDNLSSNTYKALLNEEGIKEIFNNIAKSNIVIHGIGNANEMSKRRELKKAAMEKIQHLDAVGEAYGHYFNYEGKIVHSMETIGIQKNQVPSIEYMIAVAAGKAKAKAIIAVARGTENEVLVTDEATAREIYDVLIKE
ncbi:sugar-binding domain-containing protein [Clostridium sp. ATCC 25772]|uniref:sugar-binding transcriptional regulator n=1 Tax=Clostridium sp. ATCC 25772 TaxID=1676991 RepID=UPI000784F811|nr:sugar-binding domain-containing protein [Clostridium sp. ATCC 25772]